MDLGVIKRTVGFVTGNLVPCTSVAAGDIGVDKAP